MKVILEKCKDCRVCMKCVEVCPVNAISEKDGLINIDKNVCLECGCCVVTCPQKAIEWD